MAPRDSKPYNNKVSSINLSLPSVSRSILLLCATLIVCSIISDLLYIHNKVLCTPKGGPRHLRTAQQYNTPGIALHGGIVVSSLSACSAAAVSGVVTVVILTITLLY